MQIFFDAFEELIDKIKKMAPGTNKQFTIEDFKKVFQEMKSIYDGLFKSGKKIT